MQYTHLNYTFVLSKYRPIGVVIKGVAQGILPYENETTVAVKMVKQMADNEVSINCLNHTMEFMVDRCNCSLFGI